MAIAPRTTRPVALVSRPREERRRRARGVVVRCGVVRAVGGNSRVAVSEAYRDPAPGWVPSWVPGWVPVGGETVGGREGASGRRYSQIPAAISAAPHRIGPPPQFAK